jgi:hypothetical protein
MKEDLLLLHELSIARLLKSFAIELGCSDSFADILAQVHVKKSTILETWPRFFRTNCVACAQETSSCAFFHPATEDCTAGTSPAMTRDANIRLVESGRTQRCPVISTLR